MQFRILIKQIGIFGKVHQNPVEGCGNVRVNRFKISHAIVKHDSYNDRQTLVKITFLQNRNVLFIEEVPAGSIEVTGYRLGQVPAPSPWRTGCSRMEAKQALFNLSCLLTPEVAK